MNSADRTLASPDRTRRSRRAASWLPALSVVCLLGGCEPGVMNPAGPIAEANRSILIDSMAIMLAIVVPTIIATFACAWWFRASNTRARYLPEFVYSGSVELVVWGIPALTVLLLSGVAWLGSHALDPSVPIASDKKPLEIQVVSLDWKWLFIYPDPEVASINELVIPAGTPIHLSLTSASVMNAFFIPRLGSMIYTMNGMVTPLYLEADEPGVLRGESSHFSGDGFSDMNFTTRAVSDADYAAWLGQVRAKGGRLDDEVYQKLELPSQRVPATTYGDIEPGLFDRIALQHLPPAPGPANPLAYGQPKETTP